MRKQCLAILILSVFPDWMPLYLRTEGYPSFDACIDIRVPKTNSAASADTVMTNILGVFLIMSDAYSMKRPPFCRCIFKFIFLQKNCYILFHISMEFVPTDQINIGNESLSEPIMVQITKVCLRRLTSMNWQIKFKHLLRLHWITFPCVDSLLWFETPGKHNTYVYIYQIALLWILRKKYDNDKSIILNRTNVVIWDLP